MISQERENYNSFKGKLQSQLPYLSKMQKNNKRSIIVMGLTGSGKSALIAYLLKSLLRYQKKKGGHFLIKNQIESDKCPQIDHSMYKDRGQLYSRSFQFNYQETLVELAGFECYSPTNELINTFSNQIIFGKGRQIKIVVVLEISSVMASKGGMLIQIFRRIYQLFKENAFQMLNSILLVLSKVNTDEWDIQQIIRQLTIICQHNQNMDRMTKTMLQILIENNKIVIFPRPDHISDHINIINKKIKQITPAIIHQKIGQSISQKAYNFLNGFNALFQIELKGLSQKIINQLKNIFQSQQYHSQDEIDHAINQLKKAKQIVKTQFVQFQSVQALKNSCLQLANIVNLSRARYNDLIDQSTMLIYLSRLNKECKFNTELIQNQVERQIEKLKQQNIALRFSRLHQQSMNQYRQQFERMMQAQKEHYEQLIRQMRR